MIADEIGAADVDVLLARRREADHLFAVALRSEYEILGNDLLFEDAPIMVDIEQERIDRGDPLFQPFFDAIPLGPRHRSRDQVEWEDLLDAAHVRIDGEGDPLIDEGHIGPGPLRQEILHQKLTQAVVQDFAVRVRSRFARKQFVPCCRMRLIGLEEACGRTDHCPNLVRGLLRQLATGDDFSSDPAWEWQSASSVPPVRFAQRASEGVKLAGRASDGVRFEIAVVPPVEA